RIDDLARIHKAARIEPRLDFAKRRGESRPEEWRDPFGTHETVAVLAGIRALVLLHHGARFLGDSAHLACAIAPHVEDRAYVQRSDGGMRVPGAARAVLFKHLCEPV